MDYYRCTSCGARANVVTGCPQCGRPLSDEISSLDRVILDMQLRSREMVLTRGTLMARLQGAITRREILKRALAQQQASRFGRARRRIGSVTRGPITSSTMANPDGVFGSTTAAAATATKAAPAGPPRQAGPPPTDGPIRTGPPRQRLGKPIPSPVPPGRETSTRSLQTILLGVGGLLIGTGAIVFAVLGPGSFGLAVLGTLLLIMTVAALTISPRLAAKQLTDTAQTLAGLGILLVLLDGFVAWQAGANRLGIPATTFAALVFAFTALASVAYGLRSHLLAARFGALLAAQPVLPLLAYHWLPGPAGMGLVLAGLAAFNLAAEVYISREPQRPPLLRELAWVLHGLAFGAAAVFAVNALVSTDELTPTLHGAGVLVLTAAVGQAGALIIRRWPLAEIAAGASVLAVVASVTRVGAVASPGHTWLFAALGIAGCAAASRFLPRLDRDGPSLATMLATAVVGVALLGPVLDAVTALWRAGRPLWHTIVPTYPDRVADLAGPHVWMVPIALSLLTVALYLVLPPALRSDIVSAFAAAVALTIPAGADFGYAGTLGWLCVAAVGFGIVALWSRTSRGATVELICAALVGVVAVAAGLGRLTDIALVLTVLTGTSIGVAFAVPIAHRLGTWPAPPTGSDAQAWTASHPRLGPYTAMVRERALGAAAFGLPGVAAGWTAVAVAADAGGPPTSPVLSAAFLAIGFTLTVTAIRQVSRSASLRPLQSGNMASTVVVTLLALSGGGTSADVGVALVLLAGALTLTLGPAMNANRSRSAFLDGYDIGAAVVTLGVAAALARAMTLAGGRNSLFTLSVLVFVLALGARRLGTRLRHGPIIGLSIVGVLVGAVLAADAIRAAIRTVRAVGPVWHTTPAAWSDLIANPAGYGWQTPTGLVLLAAAATILLPRPASYDVAAIGVGLAAVSAPYLLGLDPWTPVLIPFAGAAFLIGAALGVRPARGGVGLALIGALLATFAGVASLTDRDITTMALAALAVVGLAAGAAAVPIARQRARENEADRANLAKRLLAARRAAAVRARGGEDAAAAEALAEVTDAAADAEIERLSISDITHEPGAHVVPVGGAALITALLATTGAVATAAAGTGDAPLVLTASVGATALLLALISLLRLALADMLPWATAGICACAAAVTAGALGASHTAGAYAAVATLLAVLAEVIRRATPAPSVPVAGRNTRGGPGGLLSLSVAVGLPVGVAVVSLLPPIVAALFGPQFWLYHVWEGAPADSTAGLGEWGERYSGDPSTILTALLLTAAAAVGIIGIVGFHPRTDPTTTRRALVAALIPCVAMTLLVTPGAAHAPWPVGPTASLLVAVLCWLGIALTAPPQSTETGLSWRLSRRLVIIIGFLAASAGGAESLATKATTVQMLAGTVVVATIAGWRGQSRVARLFGWVAAVVAAEALAVVLALVAGLSRPYSAFGVLAVTGLLLASPLAFRALRRPERAAELTVVETAANLGALMAVALTLPDRRLAAAVLFGWGALLAVPALRPGRTVRDRRIAGYGALLVEVAGAWLLLSSTEIRTVEAYTLPFAAAALIIGVLELRRHPETRSWIALGPALGAALLPSLVILLAGDVNPARRILLILASVGSILLGARFTKVAPVTVGSVVAVVTAIHELAILAAAPNWLVFLAVFLISGGTLVAFGANDERRRRNVAKFRDALRRWS